MSAFPENPKHGYRHRLSGKLYEYSERTQFWERVDETSINILLHCPECGAIQNWDDSERTIINKRLECVCCGTVFIIERLRR